MTTPGASGGPTTLATGPQPGRKPRVTSLRSHLLRIVLVAFLPLLLFSAAIVVRLASQQRSTLRQGETARTLALTTAVDTELKRSIAALEALATSEHLRSDDLLAFYAEATRVHRSRPEWLSISLAPVSGEQSMNLLRPFGTKLHLVQDRVTFDEVVRTGRPAIGNLFREPIGGDHAFNVRVPAEKDGAVAYVLSALVRPDSIREILSPQGLSSDSVGVVLDRNKAIVARTVAHEQMVGKPASESLRDALSRASRGWFQGTTVEGWSVYTPYNRSTFSGWTVAMGIPAAAVDAPFHRSLFYLVLFGAGLLGLGIGLAWLLSSKSAESIEGLARMAEDLGSGRNPSLARGSTSSNAVAEVEELREAFAHAGRLIQQRSQERDRVVTSLREVESALRDSDRRKDEFLAMLGHELRNPLGIISTAVQILKIKLPPDPEVSELREMMARQVADMTRLIDDLLDVSRITQGRIQVSKELCDFVAIVRETTADHRESFERSGLRLELELPDQPSWLMGDRTRLAQAVANLLHNAQKFTQRGGTVTVSLAEAEGGEEVLLTVRDTGVGMEPEILQHVFQPFVQADRTIERSRGGLGLGLALVKGLIELHGGDVQASSEGSGRGAEFTIRLPLEPATLPRHEVDETMLEPAPPKRILIVEDNQMAARSLRMFLVEEGHTVEVAHSGPEGIDAALRSRPQVVLCDIGLPGADGYNVARALRGEEGANGVYLIAVTGYGQDIDRRAAREAGFDRHLTKPVNLDELHGILAALR